MAPGTVTEWTLSPAIAAMPRSRYHSTEAAAGARPEPL